MTAGGPGNASPKPRHPAPDKRWQQRSKKLPDPHQGREPVAVGQYLPEAPAHQSLGQRTALPSFDKLPADIEQAAILHAGGTCGFTAATVQAAVQVQAGFLRCPVVLQQLPYQVDSTARPIALIAQFPIGGAGLIAKATVHAATQDGIRLPALCAGLESWVEIGLQSPGPPYIQL